MTYIQDVLLNLDTLHTCDESRTHIPQNPGTCAVHFSNRASFKNIRYSTFLQPTGMLGISLAFFEVLVQRFGTGLETNKKSLQIPSLKVLWTLNRNRSF
jgi:hypothetical protein